MVGLQQRLLSSIEAFARSLKVHRQTAERHWRKAQEERNPSGYVLLNAPMNSARPLGSSDLEARLRSVKATLLNLWAIRSEEKGRMAILDGMRECVQPRQEEPQQVLSL